jgi:hypothetical protein
MMPGDRLVCAFVEPQTAGVRLRKWPLHVTIVPWFRLVDPSDVLAGLTEALRTTLSFEAVADGEAMFGIRKDRPVRLIKQLTQFVQIETKVRTYLRKKRAFLIDETTKRRPEFRSHVTNQGETGLRSGDRFRCDQIYIIGQKGNYKEIVSEVRLG